MNWLISWFMGRLPVIAVLAAIVLGVWGYGHTRYRAGEAAVQARWDAQTAFDTKAAQDAQRAADAKLARQTEVAAVAAENYAHAQTENARLAAVNDGLSRRLRAALAEADRDPVPAPAPDPGGPEPASGGLDAVTTAIALSRFADGCARSRDDLAAQVNGLLDAWPR